MDRVVLSWSGGKDATMALHELRRDPDVDVVELLTTVDADNGRVSMHGVRRDLLDHQAAAVGLPLRTVDIPKDSTNEEYESRMATVIEAYERRGVDAMAFADLFLEDVREYRAARLDGSPIDGRWPVWGRDTTAFVEEFLDRGFRAMVACVDGSKLGPEWAGRELDRESLADLPEDVDPCGENGEFHTFVFDGPIFEDPVAVEPGDLVSKSVGDGEFHYRDLLLVDGE